MQSSRRKGDFKHLMAAAGYSLQGLRAAWQHETAFRQEVMGAAVLTPLAIWLGENAVEWSLLIGSILLVMMMEIINSAIEAAVDRFGPERHELVGRAKDMGSAAVFLALVFAALVWGLIAWSHLP